MENRRHSSTNTKKFRIGGSSGMLTRGASLHSNYSYPGLQTHVGRILKTQSGNSGSNEQLVHTADSQDNPGFDLEIDKSKPNLIKMKRLSLKKKSYSVDTEPSPSKGYRGVRDRKGKCIILDVGGDQFTVLKTYLRRYPTTRLGKLALAESIHEVLEVCHEFTPGNPPTYFFDRNPQNFGAILNMYRTGDFHICQNGCMIVLQQDLEFWCIDELVMAPCCALKYYQQLEIGQNEKDDDNNTRKKEIELGWTVSHYHLEYDRVSMD